MMHFFKLLHRSDLLIVIIIVCVGVSSFALGRLSAQSYTTQPVSIETLTLPSESVIGQGVVASKNSTKFHYPWCAGAKRINKENMIQFSNIAAARSAGYEPAQNCPGL